MTWLLRIFIVVFSYFAFGFAYNTYQIKTDNPLAQLDFVDPIGIIRNILNQEPEPGLTEIEKNTENEPEDVELYVAKNGKTYDQDSDAGALAMSIDSSDEHYALNYIRQIKKFEYVQLNGTCNLNFDEAPGRYLAQGFLYDNEIEALYQWRDSQFQKLDACLQEEEGFNIKRLNDSFHEVFEKETLGASDSGKKRLWTAAIINEQVNAALDSAFKEINNTATETYNKNIKDWEHFVNNKVIPALEEGQSIDRSLAAELEAKCKDSPWNLPECRAYEIEEANRSGGYNNPICTNCDQGSELEQFASSVNQAANKYIKEPQRRQAERQARSISNYVQMTEIRDRLYADDRYQRGHNFHLKSKKHRPISLTPNSSTLPLTKPEKNVACPLAAHEYQERTACWCIKTGKRCKTVLK